MEKELKKKIKSFWPFILSTFGFVLIVATTIFLILLARFYWLEPCVAISSSMEPTLKCNDRTFLIRIGFLERRGCPLNRGDVVGFQDPRGQKELLIKRIIGLPGDEVGIIEGRLYLNGGQVQESYIKEKMLYEYGPKRVPSKSLFVLGDNRNNSDDSSQWGFLPVNMVEGKAIMVYWPISRIKFIHSKRHSFSN